MKADAARGEICFYPRFKQPEPGGVAVHVRTLREQLTKRGWTIVDNPGPETIIHAHAQAHPPHAHVYTNHGIYPLSERMPKWQVAANAAIFDNLKLADQVIAVSRWTAQQWQHLIGRQPHIIYNGVDPDVWRDVPQGRWRGKLNIDTRTPLVVWGKTSISDVLDPTPLIEMALRLPNWRFVTPLPPSSLPSMITNITCVGAQSFEAMQMLLKDADVYLATVQENHSIQVLEAMLLGKPIVGFNWGGTAETLRNAKKLVGGMLVEPHDYAKLTIALRDSYQIRQELGAAGHAHVMEHYTLDRTLDALEEVYRMSSPLLATRKRSSGRATPIKCSIIIPVYNKASWVGETVTSALRQANPPKYEIIVVNDGSTDDSLLAARRAAGADLKVRVYDIPNGGVSAARNFGIAHAKGEYICCLDADDLIDPYFLNRLSPALDADPGLGVAYSDFLAFGTDQNGLPFEAPITCDEYDFEKLKRGNIMPCCNLFRKTAWERAGGYKPINPSWEDYELWLNMGKLGWYGRRVPGMLFKYRKIPKTGRDYESHGLETRLRATVNSYHRDLYPPAITVVIPCYKHADFVDTAIQSVRAQTFRDWEIVVVDDGNDEAEAIKLRDLILSYDSPDIRLIRHAQNSGLASARNTGVDMARGSWIVPLDADDKLAPTFLEKTLQATGFDPRKFVYTDTYLWWPEAETPTKLLAAHDYDFDEALQRITWSCSILYAKEAWKQVGGYKPQMSDAGGWEDWEFTISFGEIGICGARVPEPLFYYRQHSEEQMRHKAEANKPRLQETIRRLHPEVYRGERTPMCCGAGKKTRSPVPAPVERSMPVENTMPPTARSVTVAQSPEVIVRYVGTRAGSQTWVGPSGKRYRFGLSEALGKVDARDVDYLLSLGCFTRVTA